MFNIKQLLVIPGVLFCVCALPGLGQAQTRSAFPSASNTYSAPTAPSAAPTTYQSTSPDYQAPTPAANTGVVAEPVDTSQYDFEPVGGGVSDFSNSAYGGAPCNAPGAGNSCALTPQCQAACAGIAGCTCHYIKPGFLEVYGRCGCGVWIPKR